MAGSTFKQGRVGFGMAGGFYFFYCVDAEALLTL